MNTTQQVHHTMQLLSRASVPSKALPSGASKHYKLQQEVANLIRCPICGIDSVQPVAGNLDHLVPVCREPPSLVTMLDTSWLVFNHACDVGTL